MDSRDQRAVVSKAPGKFRWVTRVVKIIPFLYLLVFTIYLLISPFVNDNLLSFIDSVAVFSPAVSGLLYILSRILGLCRWHVTACLMPNASTLESIIDSYVFTFTGNEITVINLFMGIVALVFIVSANKHFYGRKRISERPV